MSNYDHDPHHTSIVLLNVDQTSPYMLCLLKGKLAAALTVFARISCNCSLVKVEILKILNMSTVV